MLAVPINEANHNHEHMLGDYHSATASQRGREREECAGQRVLNVGVTAGLQVCSSGG